MIFLAFIFGAVGVAIIFEHFRFRARAETVEAEVIDLIERKTTRMSAGPENAHGYTQYIPVYKFTDASGVEQRIESTQGSSELKLEIGSKHKILIDPNRPGTGRPINNSAFLWGGLCIAAGVFVFLMDWYGIMN